MGKSASSPSTRAQALATLESLRVANVFCESYRSTRLPHNLEIFFGPPEEFFIAPETQLAYTRGLLVPVLDDGNFDLITFVDPEQKNFVQYSVEQPREPRDVYHSWQCYLASLVIRIAEAGYEDWQLLEIAELIGFGHLDRTIEFLDSPAEGSWELRRSRFLGSL